MADDDRSGPARTGDETAGDASGERPDERPGAVGADAKARFREALERKQGAAHRSAQGRANTGTVHGPETTGPGKRTFRRKTG